MCRNRKVRWLSVDGSMQGSGGIELPNRGEIQFAKPSEHSCHVKLIFEFEVPGPLSPFAFALTPFGNRVLERDMLKFATYAEETYAKERQLQA
jgi:uncharacterized membrane protein